MVDCGNFTTINPQHYSVIRMVDCCHFTTINLSITALSSWLIVVTLLQIILNFDIVTLMGPHVWLSNKGKGG